MDWESLLTPCNPQMMMHILKIRSTGRSLSNTCQCVKCSNHDLARTEPSKHTLQRVKRGWQRTSFTPGADLLRACLLEGCRWVACRLALSLAQAFRGLVRAGSGAKGSFVIGSKSPAVRLKSQYIQIIWQSQTPAAASPCRR